MPRKSGAAQMGYAKALETFHRNVLAAVERQCVDFRGSSASSSPDRGSRKTRSCATWTPRWRAEPAGTPRPAGVHTHVAHRRTFVECQASTAFRGALREVLRKSRRRLPHRGHQGGGGGSRVGRLLRDARGQTRPRARRTARRTSSPRSTSPSPSCSSPTPCFARGTRAEAAVGANGRAEEVRGAGGKTTRVLGGARGSGAARGAVTGMGGDAAVPAAGPGRRGAAAAVLRILEMVFVRVFSYGKIEPS